MTSAIRFARVAALALLAASASPSFAQEPAKQMTREANRSFIKDAFDDWAAGDGDVFSLLADDVTWRITGFDPAVATTYRSREALLQATSYPLRARLAGPLKPTVHGIWADGDDVLVHWDGAALLNDGSQYRNTYMWVMTVRDRKIVAVTAFLDNAAFKAALDKPAGE